jgi:hypothetical protein
MTLCAPYLYHGYNVAIVVVMNGDVPSESGSEGEGGRELRGDSEDDAPAERSNSYS